MTLIFFSNLVFACAFIMKADGLIQVADISTPLSIEQWLHAHRGGAVGLDVNPTRFMDPVVRRQLDPVTDIPGTVQRALYDSVNYLFIFHHCTTLYLCQ